MGNKITDLDFESDRSSLGFRTPSSDDTEYRYDPRSGTVHIDLSGHQWKQVREYLIEPEDPSKDERTDREAVIDLLADEIEWGVFHEYWHSVSSETNAMRLVSLLNLINYYYIKDPFEKAIQKADSNLDIERMIDLNVPLFGFHQVEQIILEYIHKSELAMELFTYLSQPLEEDIWERFRAIYSREKFQKVADEAILLSNKIGKKASADLFQRISWAALNPEFSISRGSQEFPDHLEQVLQNKYLPDNRLITALEFISDRSNREWLVKCYAGDQENNSSKFMEPVGFEIFDKVGLPTHELSLLSLNPRDNVFNLEDYLGRFNESWTQRGFGRISDLDTGRLRIDTLDLPSHVDSSINRDEIESILNLNMVFTGPVHIALHADCGSTVFIQNPRVSYEKLESSLNYLLSHYQKAKLISKLGGKTKSPIKKGENPFGSNPAYVAGSYYRMDQEVFNSG